MDFVEEIWRGHYILPLTLYVHRVL